MSMSAMEIYALLPQTNCGECGTPTCLAFAMQLANKQASLDDCPDASDEAVEALQAAAEPPISLAEIGTGDQKVKIGNETVMFRHEETFHHPCSLAVIVSDDDEDLENKVDKISSLWFERIGDMIGVELIGVRDKCGDSKQYAAAVEYVLSKSQQTPMLLSCDPELLRHTFELVDDLEQARPLVYGANEENYAEMAKLAEEYDIPLGVYADNLDALTDLTPKIKELGVDEMVIDSGSRQQLAVMDDLTQIRRQALENNFRPLGYPAVAFAEGDDERYVAMQASTYICKYASVVAIEADNAWSILPLLTLRQNIYTDPRVPPTVEDGIYEVGEPTEDSPVLMTTNFALTYFTVANEVEASRVPAWVLVVDTEGQSVLTAYSAENLNAEIAADAIDKFDLADYVNHREIILPGYVAVMSGALEEESGWSVSVGPREAASIPSFMRRL